MNENEAERTNTINLGSMPLLECNAAFASCKPYSFHAVAGVDSWSTAGLAATKTSFLDWAGWLPPCESNYYGIAGTRPYIIGKYALIYWTRANQARIRYGLHLFHREFGKVMRYKNVYKFI